MASKVFVVGSGVMGLRTAIELLSHRIRVVLRSPRPPLHLDTCSQGAGGYWMPFHVNDDRVAKWCHQTLDELLETVSSRQPHNNQKLVEIVPAVLYQRENHTEEELPAWTNDERLKFQNMSVEMLEWQNQIHKLRIPSTPNVLEAGYSFAWLYNAPVVDSPKMLKRMLDTVSSNARADVNVNTGVEYASMEEVLEEAVRHGCDAVVNCTGLGAKRLCDDDEIVGGRGVVLHYDRSCERWFHGNENDAVLQANEPPWGGDTAPCYLIPRGDVLVVGGTFLKGDTEPGIRDDERSQLERNAHRMGIDTSLSRPTGQWTGFRPYRTQVRLELDDVYGTTQGIPVVHNYGHGGAGWTVFVGTAKEVTGWLLP